MNSRDRVINALTFKEVDRIPLDNQSGRAFNNYGTDVICPEYVYGNGKRKGIPSKKGSYTDAWGCIWEVGEDGVIGEIKHPIMTEWSLLDSFQPPWDVLKNADLSMIDKLRENSDKFLISMWDTAASPFQRMQYIRGTENLFMDLAYGDAEVYKLRDMVHEYLMKQVELWCKTQVDAIHLEDDWGSQLALLISPKMWRHYFKPLYKDYCDLAHSKGKLVVMHSDGFIQDIYDDLAEIGVNAVNSQLHCMNIENIAQKHHGKLAFWGGIDRQHILPFGTPDEARAQANRIADAFFEYGKTGFVGQAFFDKDTKEDNIVAVYDAWSHYIFK